MRNDAVVKTPATAPTSVAEALALLARNSVTTGSTYTVRFSAETAAEDACKMEHIISDESFLAIKQHVAAMEKMRPVD